MHFRARNNIIQVIRTNYDESSKKAKNTIIGRMQKNAPTIDEELKEACTSTEIEEIENWINHNHRLSILKSEHAANTLAEQMALANEWFSSCEDANAAELISSEIQQEWLKLRKTFKRKGMFS